MYQVPSRKSAFSWNPANHILGRKIAIATIINVLLIGEQNRLKSTRSDISQKPAVVFSLANDCCYIP